MKSYSQFGEDIIIQNHFPLDYKGVCLNIGATDGINMDNTLHFEKQGWFCISVEANPDLYEALKMNRMAAVHCAVGAEDIDEVEFSIVTLTAQGGNQTAISATQIDDRLLRDHQFLKPSVKVINVPMMTIDTILLKYPAIDKIDFVSVDVEGTELDVLRGFDIAKWMPSMFVIENNYNDPQVEQYLRGFGYYKKLRNAVNDFYIKG